ncbi:MAG: type II toxin-antitoxin system Phd/YefM family antitoxin [Coriobacteriales bacterium]|jgi:prevent-host-death family protein|nr:type II toxin-antitoxin system Phd/YefM family antitoxin [Coriobacteriales bacterium]
MSPLVDTIDRLVPITLFNKGQSSKIFERVKTEHELIVLKNNVPAAVILSLDEYKRLKEADEDLYFLRLADERMQGDWESRAIPANEFWAKCGLSETDIDEVDIEAELE